VILYSGRSMASALLKTCSIMGRIGQRCDQRIEARPRTMRSLLIGGVPIHAARRQLLALLDVRAHPDLVAVEGASHSLLLGRSRYVRRGRGELAGQDVRAHQGKAGAHGFNLDPDELFEAGLLYLLNGFERAN
jgi:hypothetical protein